MVPVMINIDVDDLARAVDFYCAAFDLTLGRQIGGDIVELSGATSSIYLLRKAADTVSGAGGEKSRYTRHWTPVHLDFVVDDIDAALAKAIAAGATLEDDIRTHVWGRIAMFADPFGNGFCLVQFLGCGYGEIEAE
jgi:predicted enzyme related to lactoylglutathione lyase